MRDDAVGRELEGLGKGEAALVRELLDLSAFAGRPPGHSSYR